MIAEAISSGYEQQKKEIGAHLENSTRVIKDEVDAAFNQVNQNKVSELINLGFTKEVWAKLIELAKERQKANPFQVWNEARLEKMSKQLGTSKLHQLEVAVRRLFTPEKINTWQILQLLAQKEGQAETVAAFIFNEYKVTAEELSTNPDVRKLILTVADTPHLLDTDLTLDLEAIQTIPLTKLTPLLTILSRMPSQEKKVITLLKAKAASNPDQFNNEQVEYAFNNFSSNLSDKRALWDLYHPFIRLNSFYNPTFISNLTEEGIVSIDEVKQLIYDKTPGDMAAKESSFWSFLPRTSLLILEPVTTILIQRCNELNADESTQQTPLARQIDELIQTAMLRFPSPTLIKWYIHQAPYKTSDKLSVLMGQYSFSSKEEADQVSQFFQQENVTLSLENPVMNSFALVSPDTFFKFVDLNTITTQDIEDHQILFYNLINARPEAIWDIIQKNPAFFKLDILLQYNQLGLNLYVEEMLTRLQKLEFKTLDAHPITINDLLEIKGLTQETKQQILDTLFQMNDSLKDEDWFECMYKLYRDGFATQICKQFFASFFDKDTLTSAEKNQLIFLTNKILPQVYANRVGDLYNTAKKHGLSEIVINKFGWQAAASITSDEKALPIEAVEYQHKCIEVSEIGSIESLTKLLNLSATKLFDVIKAASFEELFFLKLLVKRNGLQNPRVTRFFQGKATAAEIAKDGSTLTILNGIKGGSPTFINTIERNSATVWRELAKTGEVAVSPVIQTSDDKNPEMIRVYTRYVGKSLVQIKSEIEATQSYTLNEKDSATLKQLIEEINKQKQYLLDTITQKGIIHGHPHEGNLTIEFVKTEYLQSQKSVGKHINNLDWDASNVTFSLRDYMSNPTQYTPVVRLIDWDQGQNKISS